MGAAALLAAVLLLSLAPATVGTPAPASHALVVRVASHGACAVTEHETTCTMHPARKLAAGRTYLVVAFAHGPNASAGYLADSEGDSFDQVWYCWLDNGIFGHTAIFVGNVTLEHPWAYALTLHAAGEAEYAEVVLVANPSGSVELDAISLGCPDHSTQTTGLELNASVSTHHARDLGVFLFAVINNTTVHCLSRSATVLGRCGTAASGPFLYGISTPALAVARLRQNGTETASIELRGGSCAVDEGCPWMDVVVALYESPS
jgi:hypothetical protein